MDEQERKDFALFCENATDDQIVVIYEREHGAGREDYATIAWSEIRRRGSDRVVIEDGRVVGGWTRR